MKNQRSPTLEPVPQSIPQPPGRRHHRKTSRALAPTNGRSGVDNGAMLP